MIGNGGGDGGGGGGTKVETYSDILLTPGGLDQPSVDYAGLVPLVGANQELQSYVFDNVTPKSVELQESIIDLDITRDVVFKFDIISESSIASENGKIRIQSSGVGGGEDFDKVLVVNDSIDFEINGTAGNITKFSFTKTLVQLGIENLDLMKMIISFIPAGVNPYSAGLHTVVGLVRIPVVYSVS